MSNRNKDRANKLKCQGASRFLSKYSPHITKDYNNNEIIRKYLARIIDLVVRSEDYNLENIRAIVSQVNGAKGEENNSNDENVGQYNIRQYLSYDDIIKRIKATLMHSHPMLKNTFKYPITISEEEWEEFKAKQAQLSKTKTKNKTTVDCEEVK